MVTKEEREMQVLAESIDEILKIIYGRQMWFCLTAFTFGDDGVNYASYISNGEQEDIIQALKEFADILEKKEDIPTTEGTA